MSTAILHPTTVKIDADTKDRVKRLADARQRSTHWMILEAIKQFVAREEQRESLRQDGLRAWQDYQTHGLHLTQGEADAWLARLENGEQVSPPECHA